MCKIKMAKIIKKNTQERKNIKKIYFMDNVKLFIDVDDTILDSSSAIINRINKKYNLHQTKDKMKDWNYRSIRKEMTGEEVEQMYASDEFFDTVKPFDKFMKFMNKHEHEFDIVVVTKGTKNNLSKKQKVLNNLINDFEYIPIEFRPDGEYDFDKSDVNMIGSIQVDDRVDCLKSTNAWVKILITNGLDLTWNKMSGDGDTQDIYVVNDWEEAEQIILFAKEHMEDFKPYKSMDYESITNRSYIDYDILEVVG